MAAIPFLPPAAAPVGAWQAATQAEDSLYALVFTTGPAWDPALPPAQQPHFREHSRNLVRLRDEGTIVIGGRFGELGLVVVRARDRDEVAAMLAPDPSLPAGVFRVEIHPWLTTFEGELRRQR